MLLNGKISVFYFLKVIRLDVAIVLIYATIAFLIRHFHFFQDVTIPLSVAALIGTLISLLLAFRTSQSYERWWEGRIVWGAIVNDSRTLIRQLMQFLPATSEARLQVQAFADRQAVWCYALGESLRRLPNSDKVARYLEANGIAANNIPNSLLDRHAEALATVAEQYALNPNKQVQVDATLARLTDAMGKCERIKNTVFPKSYSVLIHFIIYVFMTIFPFGLSEVRDAGELLLSVLVPTLFIIIEKTAILMQDPFENRPTDVSMTQMAQTIELNLKDMVAQQKTPAPPAPAPSYYVM